MVTRYFPAIVEGGAGPGYGVFFPDLPGCTSAGDTIEHAARNAEQALQLHLNGILEDGELIPDQRPLDAIPPDPETHEVARILVRADLPGRSLRINISIDEGLLARIDAVAVNRSAFLADAARRVLEAAP